MLEIIVLGALFVTYAVLIGWAWFRWSESNLVAPYETSLSQFRFSLWAAVVGVTTFVCAIGLTLRALEIIRPWFMK